MPDVVVANPHEWCVHTASQPDLVGRATDIALARVRERLSRHDLAAALLFDPYNLRYVTGTSVMPVWTLHALDRYVLVPAEGRPVLWEYPSAHTEPPIDCTVRTSHSWSVFDAGLRSGARARRFAADVVHEVRQLGIADQAIGVDRVDAYGFLALQEAGLTLRPAQLALEEARSVKSAPEIELLRRSVAVCDAAIVDLRDALRPGMTENQIWASFLGPAFAHGGEYVEARLLSSGRRTNPWFQESSERVVEAGDLVSFDTDLIGPAGYLADVSRAYLVGDAPATDRQRRLYADAEAFLHEILAEVRVGAAFDELGERLSRRFPAEYHAQRYPFIAHSSGLSDEYPTIVFEHHHEGEVQAGMVFSIEAYVGVEGGDEGLKLEEQVLLTDDGPEVLSTAPHDERLSGA